MSTSTELARPSSECKDAAVVEKIPSNVEITVAPLPYGGDDQLPPPPALTALEEQRLYRKIDIRFMPMLSLLYLFSYVDRNNIGNAKLQGITTQLDLDGDKYNIALTVYFVAYIVCAIPANMAFKKMRPSIWLSTLTVVWGAITTLMGLVKSYPQLVGVRVCLGIAEAGLVPGIFYYLSLWYPRYMLQTRIGIFWGGATFAGAFSGLVAFAISFMSGRAGLLGWSWIFIIEGIATVVLGISAFFVLVDLPATASFLTPEERAYVICRKKFDNSAVGEDEDFSFKYLRATILDWKVWLLCTINLTLITPVYGISLFLPTIINSFGFNTTISQLLSAPPYLVATVTMIAWAVWSDQHVRKRSPFVFMGLVLCLVGYSINISNAPVGAKYFGTYLIVTGSYGGYPAVTAWLSNNLSGQCKRAVGMAMGVMSGHTAGIIASNIYRNKDAPRFVLGHAVELALVVTGILLLPLAVWVYLKINMKRDKQAREPQEEGTTYTSEEIKRMGDCAPDFRYVL